VTLHSIGDASPLWFSGAGLVSAFAVLLRAGHLAPDGVFRRSGPLESRFSRDLDGVLGVDLGPARRTDGARLSISQLDVRAIQLAKAAVRVGIDRVLACGEITSQDLESVAVAGAFGSAMRGSDLVALGVLPTSLAHRVNSVGDAALRGAAQLALEPALFELVEPLRRGVHHVDLAAEPGFGSAFMAATEFVES
jgi:uncharacterized 2Fe-2S/4Fe-4S cluster protein (DUF4445 family)